MNTIRYSLVWLIVISCSAHASHAQELSAEQVNFFEAKIRPVLVKECYACHSTRTGNVKGGLLVDTKEALLRGGDSGPAVVPNDLDESLLWSAIQHEDYNMPPGKILSERIRNDFQKWIEMGAPDPRAQEIAKINSTITPEDVERGREFWSYQPPVKPAIPQVEKTTWPQTEIDHFVLAKLESNDLKPAPDTDLNSLLRRLTFDLTGLPPTPDQISWLNRNYKKDPDKAIAHIVDSLLNKKEFGERWGRHWLDLARYAESSGREINLTFPHAWKYRDYVIDSFNQDKPYDQFLREQVAGDLLPADNDQQWAENLTATGFLALGPKTLTEQNGQQFQLDVIDEQIDVTTRVFMGTSVACARCHDHKFDPIPQADYYAMAGIFENTTTHYGTIDTLQNRRPSNLLISPVADPKVSDNRLTASQLEKLKSEIREKQEQLAEFRRARAQQRRNPDENNTPQAVIRNVGRISTELGLLEAQLNAYDEDGNPYTYVMGVQSVDRPGNARLLVRGEFNQPAQEVPRGFPQVLCDQPSEIAPSSSGRLELARWMSSQHNPLTARVMVNRIWQHLLGNGIVRTPENFGATGQQPTHPELLDYLAVRFVEEGWSVKAIIREIVLSRIYRTRSEFDLACFRADPENHWLWRYEPKRLDAEALRDAILSVSGQLDSTRPYGSIVGNAGHALVRDGIIVTGSGGQMNMSVMSRRRRSNNDSALRPAVVSIEQPTEYRSVYLPILRDSLPRSLDVFDFAEASMVIGKRESSNTPDQGLYFLNNPFVLAQSDAMAQRLMEETSSLAEQVKMAFLLAYGREATRKELAAAEEFYREIQVSDSRLRRESIQMRKLSALCQGILASAEFRFLN